MNRLDVTEQIITAKIKKGIKWADVAKTLGKSKEWTTAGLLGQMTFTREQAEIVGKMFELSAEAVSGRSTPFPNQGRSGNGALPRTLEFLDRLAALVPPPRRHRHRYHGVLALCSPPCRSHRPRRAPDGGTGGTSIHANAMRSLGVSPELDQRVSW